MTEVERFIRIQTASNVRGKDAQWRTLPNADRVRVWEMGSVDALADETAENANPKRFIFHIAFLEGVTRGCRVSYMGSHSRY